MNTKRNSKIKKDVGQVSRDNLNATHAKARAGGGGDSAFQQCHEHALDIEPARVPVGEDAESKTIKMAAIDPASGIARYPVLTPAVAGQPDHIASL